MVHLITGYAGYEHITSADDGSFNAAFFGDGQFIMETGNKFGASIIDNNTVRVLDGDGMMYGRHFRLAPNSHEDLTITTGTAGMNRIDLIVATYMKNEDNGTETCYLEVIKGTEASGTATVPAHTTGNILNGAIFNQMPLYKVNVSGVVLSAITPLFETSPTYKALAEQYAQKFQNEVDSYKTAVSNAQSTANTAKTTAEKAQSTADEKAPKSHASTDTTYGAGNGSNYGHVKLSDSTSSTSGASGGIAATPAAVKSAYDRGTTALNTANTLDNNITNAASIVTIPNVKEPIPTGTTNTLKTLFTAPASGFYFINVYAQWSSKAGGYRNARLSTNTGGFMCECGTDAGVQHVLTDSVYLAAGQVVQLVLRQTSGGDLNCEYGGRYSYIPL